VPIKKNLDFKKIRKGASAALWIVHKLDSNFFTFTFFYTVFVLLNELIIYTAFSVLFTMRLLKKLYLNTEITTEGSKIYYINNIIIIIVK